MINMDLPNEQAEDLVDLDDSSDDSMSISGIFLSLSSVEMVAVVASEQISVRISKYA